MKPAVMTKRCLLTAIVLYLLSVIQGSKLNCSEPCLIYSATSEINAIELRTSRKVNLAANLQRAVALDVHVSKKTVYWSDINLHVIKRMNMSSGIVEDIITDDLGSVEGLAVEWESQLMYWSDYTYSKIEVASLDGSRRKLLFTEKVGRPRGIALYPKKGLMFWTDWGSTPKIERASLAGADRTVLVSDLSSSSQLWPNAIFIDYTEDRVYWIDGYADVIDSTDLNGQNRRKLTSRVHPSKDMHPFDFTVYSDTLYWSDWNTDSIEKLNWTTADYIGGFGILTSDRVFGLAVLDQSRQPTSAGNQLCKVNNGGCSYLCLLNPGGYMCACPDGLPLLPDGKSCLTEFSRFLLFTEGRNLRQLPLNYNTTASLRIPLKEHTSSPTALDYNFMDGKVYWTDMGLNSISRAFLNGSSQETIVSSRLQNPYGLAVDPFGQNIYWTDSYEHVIEVASLNGAYRAVLIGEDLQNPRDIILDVTRGFMYWTDWSYWSYESKIERSDMDGGNRTMAIQSGLVCSRYFYPSGLALDVTKNWLYWVDWYYDKLEVYEFPSNKRREIISAHSQHFLSYPFGLTLYENHLYWTDWNWYGVYRADRETGGNVQKVLSTQSRPMSLNAYDKNIIVTPVTDQCNYNNGGCNHLCLLTPFGRKCSCSDGFSFQDDGQTCHDPPQSLLFADATNRRIMKVTPQDSGSLTSLPLSSTSLSRPVALAYDVVEQRVYWTDVWRNTISRAFLNGSSQEVIIDKRLQSPNGLAVDIIGRNLYWTDQGTNKLEVSKLNGSYRTALVTHDLDQPRDIILDVNKGMMYWTSWNFYSRIEKAEMTGKERVVLVASGSLYPNGLTLDHEKNRLYWVDSSYHALEYLDLNLNNRVTLISSYYVLPSPFGLTLLGDNLYWTDTQRRAVYRANKETDGNDVTTFVTGIGQPMDIHGYNLSESKPGNSACQLDNGGCSHICLLSSTGSECACPSHLTRREDGKTCYYKYDFQKFLLFTDGHYSHAGIFLVPLNGSSYEAKTLPIELAMYQPTALGLDITEDRIYWTDISLKRISRVFINGSSPEVIVSENFYSYGLAVDPLGRNIYWTDYYGGKIEVSRMDGTMRKTLIHQDLEYPRDIILDPRKGLMYWCNQGNKEKIEVANMDGDGRRILVKRGLYSPNGLTLDDKNNRLYWVDSGLHTLEYYDLERHTITTLIDSYSILQYPFGLTSLDGYLYWTDWYLDVVNQADKETASNITTLVSGLMQPMDIHAYDRSQTLPDHSCSSSYGGCSHLCLLRPDGYRCSCPSGLSLSEDGKTCNHTEDYQKFVLFASGWYSEAGIFLVPLGGSSSETKRLPIELNMYRPTALGLDITEDRIYWTDIWQNTISRVFINGSSPEVIVSGNFYYSYGLAVDPLGRNIYWTDYYGGKIEVSRMDGSMRKTLIHQDIDYPRDIILDHRKGLMYWCDRGDKETIEVANMDGDGRRILVKRGLYSPNGLTLDDKNNRLYWVDSGLNTLEYYDLERHTITTLIDSYSILRYPFGLTSLDNHLYWTDWSTYAVNQADKETASNITVLVRGGSQPMDIHAYDRNKPLPDHPCASSYGGCSHLCLLRPNGYHCSCPDQPQPGDVCSSSTVILPFSSTPVNTMSTSSSHMETPLVSTVPSTMISSSSSSSSIHNSPSKTEQQATVSSICGPAGSTACHPGTCKNGGTCVVPGNYCRCKKYFVGQNCSVDIAASTVEIELVKENDWNLLDFKIVIATACTNLFCKTGECTSKSSSGRVKRSETATYFQPSDIVVPGISSGGENTWKVEFAVLFPTVDGQVPQTSRPVEIIQMVQANKGSIEKDVGGTIKRIGSVATGKPTEEPDEPNNRDKSTQDKEKSTESTILIAAGAGSLVMIIIIIALVVVICRMRRKRRSDDRKTSTVQMEDNMMGNTHTNIEFDNPAFDNDSIYDSISKATGSSVAANLGQAYEGGSHELGKRNVTTNKTLSDVDSNRTYQALDEAAVSNPTYSKACSGDYRIENPEKRYAALHQKKKQQPKEYAGKDEDDYLAPVHSQSDIPQRTSDTATDEDIYENLKFEDVSSA